MAVASRCGLLLADSAIYNCDVKVYAEDFDVGAARLYALVSAGHTIMKWLQVLAELGYVVWGVP
jgi:hypothetical protein